MLKEVENRAEVHDAFRGGYRALGVVCMIKSSQQCQSPNVCCADYFLTATRVFCVLLTTTRTHQAYRRSSFLIERPVSTITLLPHLPWHAALRKRLFFFSNNFQEDCEPLPLFCLAERLLAAKRLRDCPIWHAITKRFTCRRGAAGAKSRAATAMRTIRVRGRSHPLLERTNSTST